MGYVCKNCHYKSLKETLECPYCGKKGTIEKEKSASELLGEIDQLLND